MILGFFPQIPWYRGTGRMSALGFLQSFQAVAEQGQYCAPGPLDAESPVLRGRIRCSADPPRLAGVKE